MATNQQTQGMGSSNTVFIIDPWFDSSYLKTLPGMLKAAVIVSDVIVFVSCDS